MTAPAEALRQSQPLPAGAVAGLVGKWRQEAQDTLRYHSGHEAHDIARAFKCCATDLEQALQADAREKGEAFAYVVPSARVTGDGSYEDGPDSLVFADEADDYVRRVGAPLYLATQPAQASEKDNG